jgi:hypothetical protein
MEVSGRLNPRGKSPQYPLYRRLGGPQSPFGRCGIKKNFFPVPGIEPWPPSLWPVAVPTDLSWLCKTAEDSPVSIMISSEAGQSENRGFILDMGKRFFCSPQFWEEPTQPPMYWVHCFPRGEGAECEADKSPPSSAEDTNTWIYTSTPPYSVRAWYWISQAQRRNQQPMLYFYNCYCCQKWPTCVSTTELC